MSNEEPRYATDRHQRVVGALFLALVGYAKEKGGRARTSGVPLKLAEGLFRVPDVMFLSQAKDRLRGDEFWSGADLVIEVLGPTPSARMLDLVTKRAEYAKAAIPEYWVVDPENAFVTVLRLGAGIYVDAGLYERGHVARSATLSGFEVEVRAIVDAP